MQAKQIAVWLMIITFISMTVAGPLAAAQPGLQVVDPKVADTLFGPPRQSEAALFPGIENLLGWRNYSPHQRQLAQEQLRYVVRSDPVSVVDAKKKPDEPKPWPKKALVAKTKKEVGHVETKEIKKPESEGKKQIQVGTQGSAAPAQGQRISGTGAQIFPGNGGAENPTAVADREKRLAEASLQLAQLRETNAKLTLARDAAQATLAAEQIRFEETMKTVIKNTALLVAGLEEHEKTIGRLKSELLAEQERTNILLPALGAATKTLAALGAEIAALRTEAAENPLWRLFNAAKERVLNFFSRIQDTFTSLGRDPYVRLSVILTALTISASAAVFAVRKHLTRIKTLKRRLETAESDIALFRIALDHMDDLRKDAEKRVEELERHNALYATKTRIFFIHGKEQVFTILCEDEIDGKKIPVFLVDKCGSEVRGEKNLHTHLTKSCTKGCVAKETAA